MTAFPGKKLLFMGAEFGQWDEWNPDHSLDWHLLQHDTHQGIQSWLQDLHQVYRTRRALFADDFSYTGFSWLEFTDSAASVIAFERHAYDPADNLTIVCNFTPVVRSGYRVGVPEGGYYKEILNSDSARYGGSNQGNLGGVYAEQTAYQDRPWSVSLTLPPLGVLILSKEG